MDHFPETRQSLLFRIRDAADAGAWSEFLTLYRPVIYRITRRRGWQDADAQDLAQIVLAKVASKIESFDPDGPAKFRTWLSRVCQNAITDELRRRRDEPRGAGDEVAELCGDSAHLVIADGEFAKEERRAIFRWAAKHVSAEFEANSWKAFSRTTIDNVSAQQVAQELGMSVGAVYTARSRVMRKLKQKVREHDDM